MPLDFLNEIHPMSSGLIDHLSNILKTITLKKGEYVLIEGNVCKYVYFVQRGLLRSFDLIDGREVCNWFMKENDVVYAVESFLTQEPSTESIQALEDCTLHYITYSQLKDICRSFIEFNVHRSVLTEGYYLGSMKRQKMLTRLSPKKRYEHYLENYPEFVRRVPVKDIASYLGMSASTMKRLKRGD